MYNLTPFLLVATLVAAVGVASVSQAQAQSATQVVTKSSASMAQLRIAAGRASSVGPGVLVLAAR